MNLNSLLRKMTGSMRAQPTQSQTYNFVLQTKSTEHVNKMSMLDPADTKGWFCLGAIIKTLIYFVELIAFYCLNMIHMINLGGFFFFWSFIESPVAHLNYNELVGTLGQMWLTRCVRCTTSSNSSLFILLIPMVCRKRNTINRRLQAGIADFAFVFISIRKKHGICNLNLNIQRKP